ncbi:hypothetical protein C8R34_11649 [Nitrosomonas sp. Nm84]|uniref:hypothetical protein n=1 Tax=Nitrosomonas sp. Nm84 TaxID=200124 RepID=UPI000D76F249|nr:hypothetical protein [Nitrosomonas sp. Nm84]PXW86070.1 hypothetical protein C8R34_11649 [Nitrosomonas sp. Nm84]
MSNIHQPQAELISEASTLSPKPDLNSSTASAVLSEFEGRYQVGDTICIVVPVKMAFEVKWLKGQGIMHFFYSQTTADGKPIFISRDLGHGRDQFIFDNNSYNSGQFIRADGKAFTLKRLPADR